MNRRLPRRAGSVSAARAPRLAAVLVAALLAAGCSGSAPPRAAPPRADDPAPAPLSELCVASPGPAVEAEGARRACPTRDARRAELVKSCARHSGSQFEGTCGTYTVLADQGYPVERRHIFDEAGALVAYVESGSEHGPWKRVFGRVPDGCHHPDKPICPKAPGSEQ